ncbi:MAG: dihydroorotase, partial [Actinomycetota bacterium]|nr:dihydroorotase [Actinomycetota bacterium]
MLRGADVVDAGGRRRADVVVADGVVRAVGPDAAADAPVRARVLDVSGCVVAPGLVDLHAHLRQPGAEEAETV